MAKDNIPSEVSEYFSRIGSKGGKKGGKARAQKLSKKELSEQGRKAVEARWAKARIAKKVATKK